MVLGVGVDVVAYEEIGDMLGDMPEGALSHVFGPGELARAAELTRGGKRGADVEYLATRFAAKEAVTKALAPLLVGKSGDADMRMIETLNRQDGSPYVNETPELVRLMRLAGVGRIHVSISTESEMAFAFALVESC